MARGPSEAFVRVGGPPLEPRRRVAGEAEETSVILMMQRTDPDYAKATDARKVLGSRWSSFVSGDILWTCRGAGAEGDAAASP